MKQRIHFLLVILFISIPSWILAQSCVNYSVARTTGITYSSISGSSPSYFAWRNTSSNQDDDNRSYSEPIGFDFWYLGVRYTHFSGNLNGIIDFSASTSDGNNGGTGPYGPNSNNIFSTANMSMLSLAAFYDDLWTGAGGTTPVATSIFYKTTGTAPNRVLTVEWDNFEKFNSSTGSLNFQVRIHETSGVIEFVYGTMTTGTGAFTYACGINGNWTTGAPTSAVLLTQQTANTTVFSAVASNNLSTLPTTNSKLSFTPPVPNGTPANISFTAISKLGMTLHWTDNATNEVGYAIYHSMDNIDFIYAGQTAANVTSVAITGLLPGTNYYWKVHAITEGGIGTALTGTHATLPAGIITSIASGNWSSTATWDCHCIPTLGDDITIANGHNVTLDVNGLCNMLIVGQGVSGSLIIGNNAIPRTLTVDSDIVIHPGAIVTTGSTAATHSILLDDDIVNHGTLDLAPTATRVCNITFNNDDDSDQVVSGSGTTTNFNKITVTPASSANKIEITSSHFTAATNFLTLTNGIFKLSSSATVTPFTGNVTLPISTVVWLNHPGATLSTTGGTITLLGSIQATAGIFNIGNAADNNLTFDGGSLLMDGGTMYIAGRLDNLGITALTNFTMTSGALTVATVSSTTTGIAPFSITEVGSAFNISGGTIIIRKPGAGNLGYVNTGGTNGIVSGGTLQIGDASTPASQTFQINSSIGIPNLVVSNGVAVTAQLATNPLTVKNNISINAGTLNSNSLNISLGGNWTNNAGFTAGAGSVTCNGTTAQTIAGTSGTSFNNLTVNNASGINFLQDQTVNSTLTLTSGNLDIGSHNLIITGSGAVAGSSFSATKMIIADGGGEVRKSFSATGSYSFPIGDNTGTAQYSPVTLNFASGTFAGGAYSGVKLTNAKHPNNASSTDFLNRYWTVSNSGITSPSFNVTATYLPADITGTEANIASAKFTSALPWIKYGVLGSNTLAATSVTNTGTGIVLSGISNQVPNVSITGGGVSICTGGSVALSSTVTNGTGTVTYSWSPGTGLSSSTISNPTASPTITTTYTLTVTDGDGFTNSASTVITVNAVPTIANAGPDQTGASTCGSTTVTLAANTAAIGTGAWSIVSGSGGTVTTPTSATSTFTGTAGTTYTLRWTVSNSPCTASTDDVVITFNQNPTVSSAGPDQTGIATCGSTTVILAANTPAIGTGAWSIVSGVGGTVTTASSASSAFTGTPGTTYTLRWTISGSPCTASTDDVLITFNHNPTLSNAGLDQTGAATCGLTTVTLAANVPTAGIGDWVILSGTGGTVTTPTSATSTFTGTAGTTYTLKWRISNSPCASSGDNVVITFNQNPTTSNAGPDQTGAATCGSTTATLAANIPAIGTGVWSIVSGTGGTIISSTSATSTFTGTGGTTYTLRWTISNSPCTASTDDVVITFNQNPTTANAGPDQTGAATCGQTSATLAANTPVIGTGAWSIVSGSGGTVTAPTNATSTFTGTAGTTYTLRWTISNSPCTASTDEVIITFNQNPGAATISYTGSPFCSNTGTATVTQTGTAGGTYSSTAGLIINSSTGAIILGTSTAGTYTVTYTMTNGVCITTTTTLVTITALPSAIISYADTPYCKSLGIAQPVTRTGIAGGAYSSTAGLTINSVTGAITPGTSTSGTYTVTYTMAASGGCSLQTATTSVKITAIPSATVNYTGSPYCSNAGSATVTMTGTAGGTYSSTTGLTINASTGDIILGTSTAGIYTVTYTVAASGGCSVYSTTTSINIIATPVVTSGGDKIVCFNGDEEQTITATATGGTISWYDASTGGNIIISPVQTGVGTVTYYAQASNGVCVNPARTAVTLTINNAAVTPISDGDQTVCSDGDAHQTLVANVTSDSDLMWYDAATGGHVVSPLLIGIGSITYYAEASNGLCYSTTRTPVTLTINPILATPDSISGPVNACPMIGSATPTTYSINEVPGATFYTWHIPAGTTMISGQGTTSIQVVFDSSFALTHSRFIVTAESPSACTSAASVLEVLKIVPGIPIAISGPTNVCGLTGSSTTVTYSIDPVEYATSYSWVVSGGIVLLNGQGTTSIQVNYLDSFAYGSIKVTANSNCGSRAPRSLTISKLVIGVPSAISGPTNACPYIGTATQVVYSIRTVLNAISYTWTVPSNMTLVNGQGTTAITVTFNSGYTSGLIKVRSIGSCGSSNDRSLTVVATTGIKPGVISGPVNACVFIGTSDKATYTIRKVINAMSYLWSVPQGATIVSHPGGTGLNDTIITVAFYNNFVTGTMISVQSLNCLPGASRTLTVSRTLPSKPGLIAGPINVCPYMVSTNNPLGIPVTYSIQKMVGAQSYIWTVPVGSRLTGHPGGTGINDTSIQVTYDPGFVRGNVTIAVVNGCGAGASRSLAITRLTPGTPSNIDVIQIASCPNRVYTYTLAAMPSNATNILWTIPSTATLVSGQGTISITISYPSTSVTGTIMAKPYNNCSSGSARAVNIKLPVCSTESSRSIEGLQSKIDILPLADILEVKVFPNPSASDFKLELITASRELINVRILDMMGNEVKKMVANSTEIDFPGNDLRQGTYLIEVTQGKNKTIRKFVKL